MFSPAGLTEPDGSKAARVNGPANIPTGSPAVNPVLRPVFVEVLTRSRRSPGSYFIRPVMAPPLPPGDAPSGAVGSAGVVDGRWISEVAFRQTLDRANSTNRRHLLDLQDGYRFLSLRVPFRDLLTKEQRSSYFFIDDIAQWDEVATRFQSEVDKYRCPISRF